MDQTGKTFTSEGEPRKWIGRIIMAVILGEAIWNLIVSGMNNLVVPWLGDVMGPSAGLPTSFTQRPYNYPDLFVSVLEFCIAGIVAAIVNYFFQRPRAERVKPVQSKVPIAPVEPARVVAQGATVAMTQATSPGAPPAPVPKRDPVTPPASVTVAPTPFVAPAPVGRPVEVAPTAPSVASSVSAKPLPTTSKAGPPKPKKPKEVYYNIVGEPMPPDED